MSVKGLTESTPVTMAIACATALATLAAGIQIGTLSQRMEHVEQSQGETNDWAKKTADVLARLETRADEHGRRLDAAENKGP